MDGHGVSTRIIKNREEPDDKVNASLVTEKQDLKLPKRKHISLLLLNR